MARGLVPATPAALPPGTETARGDPAVPVPPRPARPRWLLLLGLLAAGCEDGPSLPPLPPDALARLVPGRSSLAEAERLLGRAEAEARYHVGPGAGPGANFILNHPVSTGIGAAPDGWRGCLVPLGGGGRQECGPGAAVPPGFVLDLVTRSYRFRARATEGPDAGRPVEVGIAASFDGAGVLTDLRVGRTRIRTLRDRITGPRLW